MLAEIESREGKRQKAYAEQEEKIRVDPKWQWRPDEDPRPPPQLVTWAKAHKALREAIKAEASARHALTLLISAGGGRESEES